MLLLINVGVVGLLYGGWLHGVALVLLLATVGHDAKVTVVLAAEGELALGILTNWLIHMLA